MGKLVRMDRGGALPDRCVTCNAGAGGYRLSRKLYWSPASWRIAAAATPFVVLALGVVTQTPLLMVLFWPLVIVLMIAHTFVRTRLQVDLGLCPRHRRLRTALGVLSIGCVLAVLAWLVFGGFEQFGLGSLWLLIATLLGLAVAQAYAGIQAISIKKLTDQHAWLARTGKAFRAELPELPA